MLSNKKIEYLARKFLEDNKCLIDHLIKITLPNESELEEEKEFLIENNFACVSFCSIHYDNRDEYPLDPGVYIVYVNLETGELHMPRHM